MANYKIEYRVTQTTTVRAPSPDQAKELAKKQLDKTDEVEPVILSVEEESK